MAEKFKIIIKTILMSFLTALLQNIAQQNESYSYRSLYQLSLFGKYIIIKQIYQYSYWQTFSYTNSWLNKIQIYR